MKTKSRFPIPAAAAGITVCLLAACGQNAAKPGNLALACQTQACTCEAATSDLFRKKATADIKWRLNGDAYCPNHFVLKRIGGN